MKKKKHMTEEVAGKLEDGVTEPETVSVKESESVSAEQPEAAEPEESEVIDGQMDIMKKEIRSSRKRRSGVGKRRRERQKNRKM